MSGRLRSPTLRQGRRVGRSSRACQQQQPGTVRIDSEHHGGRFLARTKSPVFVSGPWFPSGSSLRRNHAVLNPSGIKFLFESSVVVLSTMPIAWMYPTSESLLIGNPLQKHGKLLLFVF